MTSGRETKRSWRFPADRVLGGKAPPRARTIGQLLDEIAARQPDVEAIVFSGFRCTYGELHRAADALAAAIVGLGLGKGDHVAIFMGNRPEWIVVWMALNRLGMTVVGVSSWSSATELEYILRHSDARMLVHADRVGPRRLDEVVAACMRDTGWSPDRPYSPRLPCLRLVLPVSTETPALRLDLPSPNPAISAELVNAIAREVRPSDVALLLYTSGSTATPKGVQLVHRALVENAYDIGEAEDLRPGDRFWLSLPLFWSAGSANSAMAALTHGATIVLQEFFSAKVAASLLRDERCTHYFAFPNVTRAIYQELGANLKLPASRVAVTSGQPEILRMLQSMGFTLLLHPYGTTEDYGFATINSPDDALETLGWSQGRPLPGIELMIVDPETGQEMPTGKAGEILLRGNVSTGYYKDEDKNRDAFDDTGYFHTGDTAIVHSNGRLQFLGRNSEMIKTSGFNVSPAEVENALLTHAAVSEAHVVGIPDEERGQTVVACVKLSRTGVDMNTLREHCAAALSSYKVPQQVVPFDQFPLTSTGKVSKQALRELIVSRVQKK